MLVGRSPDAGMTTAVQVGGRLAETLRAEGMRVPGLGAEAMHPEPACSVLAWAASGAMTLTGWPDGPPQWPTGDLVGGLGGTAALLAALAGSVGVDPGPLDIGSLLTGRAAARGGARRGATSLGGQSRILRSADGWLAVTLSRSEDLELLPAFVALAADGLDTGAAPLLTAGRAEDAWDQLEHITCRRPARGLMEAAQLLGLATAEVATPSGDHPPWSIGRLGASVAAGPRRWRIVDFSALWAGPLCAHLLGRCGAEVVKVEDVGRPDAARRGDPWLFEQLHAGHDHVVFDFRSGEGRRALAELVDQADVVVEASRPRALGHLDLHPGQFLGARPGRTWVSITAWGRSGARANWVGFGDDAAAGAGLVASQDPRGPAFCADAVGDPITGLFAATGALASMAGGGGHLIDCSMAAASAFANRFGGCGGEHRVEQHGGGWSVAHGEMSQRVEPPRLSAESSK